MNLKEHKTRYFNEQHHTHYFFYEEAAKFAAKRFVHGEYKRWSRDGILIIHHFFKRGNNITGDILELVNDILSITNEEKLLIKLRFGIDCHE